MARALVDIRILQREYLLAISRAMTAELDLHDLLRLILKSAVELVSGQAGMIALADPGADTLRVAAVYGIPPHLVDHFGGDAARLPRDDLLDILGVGIEEVDLAAAGALDESI